MAKFEFHFVGPRVEPVPDKKHHYKIPSVVVEAPDQEAAWVEAQKQMQPGDRLFAWFRCDRDPMDSKDL